MMQVSFGLITINNLFTESKVVPSIAISYSFNNIHLFAHSQMVSSITLLY